MLFTKDFIKTFVGLCVYTLRFCYRIVAFFTHHTFYLSKKHFVFSFYLQIPNLFAHFSFAIVDGIIIGMFHQFRGDWLYVFHLDIMVNVTYLQLFLLHKAIDVWTSSIHLWLVNKIIMKTKINKNWLVGKDIADIELFNGLYVKLDIDLFFINPSNWCKKVQKYSIKFEKKDEK